MTQQIINLGVGPDTQTGDSLFTAFNKVNDNFGELYTVFGSNSITTINANVVLANSITVSSNVRSGNLFAYGNVETIGYVIAAGVFYPNGVPISGAGQVESNLIPITSNIYSVGNITNQFTQGYFSSNITLSGANVTVRNTQLLINGQIASGNYGNSNVAQYLPVYGGNIAATITTANQPYITNLGTLTSLNVVGNTSISGNLDVSGTITYLNVRDFSVQDPIVTLNTGPNGAPLVSNNSFDSGVRTYYYDDNQNKASFFGRTNSTGYFEYFSNVISETGNIITGTYGTIKTANLILTSAANIAGNVTGNYFLGNGRFLSGIDATSIQNGNSNVKVYLDGNVSVTTAGANTWNFGTAGQLTVPGAILTASASKLDLVGFGPNTAYLTTTADDSTALFMGAAVVDLRALDSISITTNTDDTSYLWTFAADGNLTLPGNLITSSNVIANYFLGNFVGNISGNISAAGANTQVLFNDDNTTNATSGLTFNKSSNLLTVGGTVSALSVNVAGYTVIDSNGNVVTSRLIDSGVTAGTYGNASSVPSVTVDSKGRVTAISNVAVAGVSNVSYDSTTGNLTVSTSSGTNYVVDLGVGTADSPIFSGLSVSGNTLVNALTINNSATIGSTLGVTGNINGNGITLTGSLVARGAGDFDGGLQSTPIGNASASTGQFTTVSATGNITGAALTSNGSVTAQNTLSAAGGIQNTPIGNASASTGQFTAVSATGNITGAALTSNGSITSGTTLSAAGGIQNTPIGNVTPSTAIFTSVSVSGNSTVNALTVNTNATVGTTLGVTGNINGNGITLSGSLRATGPGDFDGGLQSTPIGNAAASTGQFTTVSATGNVTGAAVTANGSVTAGSTLHAAGGIQNTSIGNVAPSTAQFTTVSTSGNVTAAALTVNNSITVGSTLGVAGTITSANISTINGVFATVQAATIGNTGTNYNGSTYTATGSFNGPVNGTLGSAGGNTAIVSTLSATGAADLSSLQVNNSATVGSGLTVGGLATLNNFYANTNSTVAANLTVVGSLIVTGNVIASGSNNTFFTDSILELHTLPNLANLTFDDGKDIGIRFHYYKTQNTNAFLGWQNSTGYLEWLGSDVTEDIGANIITGTFGTIKTGELILANSTPSTGLATGALQVNGGASFSGNVYANGVAYFGNATAIALDHPLLVATTTANTYAQIQIQNQSNGSVASSDFIATADDGTDSTKYIDMGINSSGWDQDAWTVSGARDGYLYTSGVNLTIGTDTVGKTVKIHTGGLLAACVVATFNDTGTVSSTSQTGALVLTGGLGVSGEINGGSDLGLVGNATISGLTVNNTTTIGSTLGVTGNINGNGIALTGSLVASGPGKFDGGLQATPIGNASASTAQFTTVSTSGNVTTAALTANGSVTAGSTLHAAGGIQNTPIGNVTPSTAQFTTVAVSGNVIANALSVNNTVTIGGTLGVTGNLSGTDLTLSGSLVSNGTAQHFGGLQNTPIGNATPSTAVFTTESVSGNSTVNALTVNTSATIGNTLGVTGNIIGSGLTLSGSEVVTGSLHSLGGLQATPIGNAAASTAQFTTVSSTGNITAAAMTVNGSATVGTTLSAAGGLQATPIGNATPNSAAFTTVTTSGNLTTSALSVNNSVSIGTTLGVTGNINGNGITLTDSLVASGPGKFDGGLQATPIGNATASTAQFTTVSTTGNVTGAALTVNGSATIGTTLGVFANLTMGSGSNIIGANTIFANSFVAAVSFNGPVNGTLGTAGGNTAIVSSLSVTGNANVAAMTVNGSAIIGTTLEVIGNITVGAGTGGNIVGADIISANSFVAAISFDGPLGASGGNSAIVSTLSATGNVTINALTVNASATIGTTLGVTGNATVGNILATGFYFANGTPLTTSAGGTGGQLQFNSNSSFAGATYLTYQSGNGQVIANSGITSVSNVSGAVVVLGGVGVTGNVYVSQRVGFVAANSASAVYQIFNAATNSLDTVFE